jgi:hypothetical protein
MPMRPPPHLNAELPSFQEDPDDDVLRNREQPPLDEHKASRKALGILDFKRRGVVGRTESERWIAIRPVRGEGIEADSPRPAQDTGVEVEDAVRIAPCEEDREERGDA